MDFEHKVQLWSILNSQVIISTVFITPMLNFFAKRSMREKMLNQDLENLVLDEGDSNGNNQMGWIDRFVEEKLKPHFIKDYHSKKEEIDRAIDHHNKIVSKTFMKASTFSEKKSMPSML